MHDVQLSGDQCEALIELIKKGARQNPKDKDIAAVAKAVSGDWAVSGITIHRSEPLPA